MRYVFIRRIICMLPVLLLSGFLLPQVLNADETYNGVSVKFLPELSDKGGVGYQDYTFLLKNTSNKPRQVEFEISAGQRYYESYIQRINKTVILPPGAEVQSSILQPPLILPYPKISLNINGKVFENDVLNINTSRFNNFAKDSFHHATNYQDVLVSQSIPPNSNGTIFSMVPPNTATGGGVKRGGLRFNWANIPVEQWSSNWLTYTPYHGIMVSSSDLNRMSAGASEALHKYAASGGNLIVFDEKPQSDKARVHIGFGAIYHYNKKPANFDDKDWGKLDADMSVADRIRCIGIDYNNDGMKDILPVMGDIRVPIRQLFLIMLAFFVVIGPVNIYILRRKKKMIWILWTTPTIAIVFSGMVVLCSLLSEGWHTRARNNTLTILDEDRQLAATLGFQGFYCPLSPRKGLKYADSAAVMPLAGNYPQACSVDLSNGQLLASGWVRSRIPAYFFIQQVESRRERLKINYANSKEAELVNGTGAVLSELKIAVLPTPGRPSRRIWPRLKIPISTMQWRSL